MYIRIHHSDTAPTSIEKKLSPIVFPKIYMMCDDVVHVALLPSAGIGHLTPFLRLAALFLKHNCKVTLFTPQPYYSISEAKFISRFLSTFPQVNQIHFDLLPSSHTISHTPEYYFQSVEAIRVSSAHLLSPLISSLSPPLSAFITDFFMISSILPITRSLSIPNYVLCTSCATFFTFFSHFSKISASFDEVDAFEIPGISSPLPKSSISPNLLVSNSIWSNMFMEDGPEVTKCDGIFINTFDALEHQTLEALNAGKVLRGLPPVFAVGPLKPFASEKEGDHCGKVNPLKWLDDQPNGSVVFVCFGSSTVFGKQQLKELGEGLVRSGCRFLWVVKDKIAYSEEFEEVLGFELAERVKEKGLVMKEWVHQTDILGHKAVGGFISHCGWNSTVEAAWNGVPVLAWPQYGDQKINAHVLENSGLGIWNKDWGWLEERVVKGEEIGEAIKVMMNNESLKVKAAQIKEAGKKAISLGGDCEYAFQNIIQKWKKNVEKI